ncbi:hypothetical protein ETQ85_03635 [Zoogloea oleivorans]|uniref:Uncharacterized protein n=1 Tax=Zoogloea oleivorans TaxID=1552750 RepID=A0A6C2D3Y7_9RHOO|nr:hypothetical protein [Zoogloea oleivorans]TYC61160.1 hypothetical protein ETQ85_03635 [Zoogloea oleivorans]
MNWLQRLPGSRKEIPGFEWRLLRKLPLITLVGTLLPALYALNARVFDGGLSDAVVLKAVQSADIVAIATVVLHWTVVFTLAIGCVIVMVMKGHGYIADAYPLQEREAPLE